MIYRFGAYAAACLALTANLATAAIPESMHPDFELKEIPLADKYKTMGMGFLSDGRMVIATTEFIGGGDMPKTRSADHKVFIISGAGGSTPTVKEIANSWYMPVGVTIVNDKIYISDRDGFYEINNNSPANADLAANRTKIATWPNENNWGPSGEQWHQYVFDPIYWQGSFYAPYSGSIRQGGPSDAKATSAFSGAFLKWDLSGKLEKFAGGLRSPNGVNVGPNGDMFVADNEGSWLPSSTFNHMKSGKFYGHKQSPKRDATGAITQAFAANWAEGLPPERPTAWLDHGNVRSSPSQPIFVDKGRFAGDWLLGDVNNPGLVRIALDDVEGTYNGAVFWFGHGFGKSAINRMAWGKDGALYVGSLMKVVSNWPEGDKTPMYRLTVKTTPSAFDMKAVKHLADGVEILFTEPVAANSIIPANFPVSQRSYTRMEGYGQGEGPIENLSVSSTEISADGKRVHLKITGLKDGYVAYFKLGAVKSATGADLWNNESWFTMNKFSTRAWNGTVSLTEPNKRTSGLSALVRSRVSPAGVVVTLDLPGHAEATLRSVNGAALRTANGAGAMLVPTQGLSKGVYLLEVRHGADKLVRPVSLSF